MPDRLNTSNSGWLRPVSWWKAALSQPARGPARRIQAMPVNSGETSSGSGIKAATARLAGRSVRVTSQASNIAPATLSTATDRPIRTVFSMAKAL